jgi:hypothetical protein
LISFPHHGDCLNLRPGTSLDFPKCHSGELARALIVRRTGWIALLSLVPSLILLLLGRDSGVMVFWLPIFLTIGYHKLAARRFAHVLASHDYRICCGCAYDLRNRPDSGRCPECGETYDVEGTRRAWMTFQR